MHSTKLLLTKESNLTVISFANKLVSELNKWGDKDCPKCNNKTCGDFRAYLDNPPTCDCTHYITNGFRYEYDGMPVIYKYTGNSFIASNNSYYWAPGKHYIYQYAVLGYDERKQTVSLYNYEGSAGRPWENMELERLTTAFRKVANMSKNEISKPKEE